MDYFAGLCELIGIWKVGDKKRWSFLVFMLGNFTWVVYVLWTGSTYGLLLICVPAFFMNVRNFIKWGRDEHSDSIVG